MANLMNNTESLQNVKDKVVGMNNEINTQTGLISLISDALEGKTLKQPNDPFKEMNSYLLEKGFHRDDIVIEEDKTTGTDGNYNRFEHSLGITPIKVVLIPRSLEEYKKITINDNGLSYRNGYFMGISTSFGTDSNANRTVCISIAPDNNHPLQFELTKMFNLGEFSQYNFCSGATDTYVLLRAGASSQTKLLKGNYYLYTSNS